MSYSMLGAVGAGSFKLVNGVARPVDSVALGNFKAFQQELSRFGALRVDGDIGPATVKLYNKVVSGSWTAAQIATGIPANTLALMTMANSTGKPPAAALPPSKPVSKPDGTVVEGNPPPYTPETMLDSAMGFVTSPMGLMAGAAVIGLVLWKKGKGASSSSSTALVSNPGKRRKRRFWFHIKGQDYSVYAHTMSEARRKFDAGKGRPTTKRPPVWTP